jgi:hypothetical protein
VPAWSLAGPTDEALRAVSHKITIATETAPARRDAPIEEQGPSQMADNDRVSDETGARRASAG